MPILIKYDIKKTPSSIHTEVKDAMIEKGYEEHVPIQGGSKAKFPNTTLLKDNITPLTASNDLLHLCANKNAHLEKYITLSVTLNDGRAKSDE